MIIPQYANYRWSWETFPTSMVCSGSKEAMLLYGLKLYFFCQEWLICSWPIRLARQYQCAKLCSPFISVSNRVRSISGREQPNLFYFSSHKKNAPLRNMFWLHLESMCRCTLWVSLGWFQFLPWDHAYLMKRGWTVKITEPELRRPFSKTFSVFLFFSKYKVNRNWR